MKLSIRSLLIFVTLCAIGAYYWAAAYGPFDRQAWVGKWERAGYEFDISIRSGDSGAQQTYSIRRADSTPMVRTVVSKGYGKVQFDEGTSYRHQINLIDRTKAQHTVFVYATGDELETGILTKSTAEE